MKITREHSGFLCLFLSILICIISSSIVETSEIKNVVLENEIVKPSVNSNIITEDVMKSRENSINDTVPESKLAKK